MLYNTGIMHDQPHVCLLMTYMLSYRPMYVDSTNVTEPSGEMPVSRLLIQHIEPLFQVRCPNLEYLAPSRVDKREDWESRSIGIIKVYLHKYCVHKSSLIPSSIPSFSMLYAEKREGLVHDITCVSFRGEG